MKQGRTGESDDGHVEVRTCSLRDGRFEASVQYEAGGPSCDEVRRKFRLYHKLLRAAIRDEGRKIDFEWHVRSQGKDHSFEYRSDRRPFEELVYRVGDRDAVGELWAGESKGISRARQVGDGKGQSDTDGDSGTEP